MTEQRRETERQYKIDVRVFGILPDLVNVGAAKRVPDEEQSDSNSAYLFYQSFIGFWRAFLSWIKSSVFDVVANLFRYGPLGECLNCTGNFELYSIFPNCPNSSILSKRTLSAGTIEVVEILP
jgi:hypothetical protein